MAKLDYLYPVLWGLFGIYFMTVIVDRTNVSLTGTISSFTAVCGNLRILLLWAYAALFLWLMFSTQFKSQYAASLSIVLFIIAFGLQSFTANVVKSDSDEKHNELVNFDSNSFLVFFLYAGAVLLSWWFFNKKGKPLIMSGVCGIVVLIYLTYATLSANAARTLSKVHLTKDVMSSPLIILFFMVILYSTLFVGNSTLDGKASSTISTLLKSSLFLAPPLLMAFMLGSSISDTMQQQKYLMVMKLQNVMKQLSSSFPYQSISEEYLQTIIDSLLSIDGQSLSASSIHSKLIVTSQAELTRAGVQQPTALPLDLWNEIESYIVKNLNKSFNFDKFLDSNKKNVNPIDNASGSSIYVGVLMIIISLLTIIGWAAAAYFTNSFSLDISKSILNWILVVIFAGVIAYLGYLLRNTSHNIDFRNETYCNSFDLTTYAECVQARPQYEHSTFFLVDQIDTITNGSGVLTVNGINILGTIPLVGDDPGLKQQPSNDQKQLNMAGLYHHIAQFYFGPASPQNSLNQFQNAYNTLVKIATDVNLKSLGDENGLHVYTGSADDLNAVTFQNIYDLITDSDNFATSANLTRYVPKNDQVFSTDNDYFGIHYDPNTQVTSLFFNYPQQGQLFKDNLTSALQIKKIFSDSVFTNSTDYMSTLNPTRTISFLSGQFDINSPNPFYINVFKAMMKSYLQTSIITSTTTPQNIWDVLSASNVSWENVKMSMNGLQYDFIVRINALNLNSDDKIIVTDILNHSIRNQYSYDQLINAYLEKLFWIVKLEMVTDTSQVTQDIKLIETKTILQAGAGLAILIIILGILFYAALNFKFRTHDHFMDYFQTSIAGSTFSPRTAKLFILMVYCLVFLILYNYMNLYRIENTAVSSVLFTDKTLWGGKMSTVFVTTTLILILALSPLFFKDGRDRLNVYFVAGVLTAMLFSPFSYFKNPDSKSLAIAVKKFNTISVVIVCALAFFVIINSNGFDDFEYFKWAAMIVVILAALTFTSIPTMYFEGVNPDISDSELKERTLQINLGTGIGLVGFVALFFVYFILMKKKLLFFNEIEPLELPPSVRSRFAH